MEKTILNVNESGVRVDKFVSTHTAISREQIKRLLVSQHITVNDKTIKPNFKLNTGDVIEITIPKPEATHIIPNKMNLNIVFEDPDLIVLNKDNNVVVHPAPGHKEFTLVNGLIHHCKDLSGIGGVERPGVVHRIDKKTTGLLVFAKNDKTHINLSSQFKEKTNTRVYHALVHGIIPHPNGTINAPIGRARNDRKKYEVTDINSKDAITHFKVIEHFENATYVELTLETGRTHQIRVHMQYIKHPVMGDNIYGPKKQQEEFGQYLHAHTLGFVHPTSNEEVNFSCPIPNEFEEKLKILREK